MTRDFVCIICPKGCRLKAEIRGEQVTVTGTADHAALKKAIIDEDYEVVE